mmetsp:Transcript_83711/g.167663  ORF Transcript_83711/g.167663 Transcript_83711/m.167663 type:complete len:203 (-) Transcript_83711:1-609(-)
MLCPAMWSFAATNFADATACISATFAFIKLARLLASATLPTAVATFLRRNVSTRSERDSNSPISISRPCTLDASSCLSRLLVRRHSPRLAAPFARASPRPASTSASLNPSELPSSRTCFSQPSSESRREACARAAIATGAAAHALTVKASSAAALSSSCCCCLSSSAAVSPVSAAVSPTVSLFTSAWHRELHACGPLAPNAK